MKFSTPVLFVIFNRPDVTQRVFNEIKKAQPKQLFVCADGPRAQKAGENELCAKTRAIIDQVDWDCQVFKRYSDVNLGCRVSVGGGINWFFEQAESGIILEDDCLPTQSFFWFCEELLERYKDDKRIMQISGANYFPDPNAVESYYFSKFNDISGWATWRRAWKLYDMNMSKYPEFKKHRRLNDYFDDKRQALWLSTFLDEAVDPATCFVWSSQWSFTIAMNNGLVICPNVSLTMHLGFSENAANFHKDIYRYPTPQLQQIHQIVHPAFILPDKTKDAFKFKVFWHIPQVKMGYRFRKAAKNYLKELLDAKTYERMRNFYRQLRRQT